MIHKSLFYQVDSFLSKSARLSFFKKCAKKALTKGDETEITETYASTVRRTRVAQLKRARINKSSK